MPTPSIAADIAEWAAQQRPELTSPFIEMARRLEQRIPREFNFGGMRVEESEGLPPNTIMAVESYSVTSLEHEITDERGLSVAACVMYDELTIRAVIVGQLPQVGTKMEWYGRSWILDRISFDGRVYELTFRRAMQITGGEFQFHPGCGFVHAISEDQAEPEIQDGMTGRPLSESMKAVPADHEKMPEKIATNFGLRQGWEDKKLAEILNKAKRHF